MWSPHTLSRNNGLQTNKELVQKYLDKHSKILNYYLLVWTWIAWFLSLNWLWLTGKIWIKVTLYKLRRKVIIHKSSFLIHTAFILDSFMLTAYCWTQNSILVMVCFTMCIGVSFHVKWFSAYVTTTHILIYRDAPYYLWGVWKVLSLDIGLSPPP